MNKNAQRGYSLIEVLIAVAVTGFVLLTVVTLFYMGRKNVYSGKQNSYAVAVATRMLEDLSSMQVSDVITAFGISDTTALSTVTVNGVQYANSWQIDTTSAGGANDPSSYLTNWKALIGNTNLANATAGMIVTPKLPNTANQPWTTAQIMRIRVYVTWAEGQRNRFIFFDTSKVNRP